MQLFNISVCPNKGGRGGWQNGWQNCWSNLFQITFAIPIGSTKVAQKRPTSPLTYKVQHIKGGMQVITWEMFALG